MKPPYHMPYNNRMDPKTVIIENLPGFQDLKFHKVNQPAFLDHALDGQAVVTQVFTLTEMEEAIRKADGRVYIYKCTQTWEEEQAGKYCLRWKVTEDKLAPLMAEFDIHPGVVLDQNSYRPLVRGEFKMSIECLNDLERAWGRDEVVRQLGEYIAQGMEVRNYDGKPELPPPSGTVHEHADPVDPHPAQA